MSDADLAYPMPMRARAVQRRFQTATSGDVALRSPVSPSRMASMDTPVWYRVRMPSDEVQAGRHIAIQQQFEIVFRQLRGKHNDVAMYSSGFQGNVLTLYFSPATHKYAATFLQDIQAEVCDQPADVEGFLVGHTGTMRKLLSRES
jgi:hypothetical protein